VLFLFQPPPPFRLANELACRRPRDFAPPIVIRRFLPILFCLSLATAVAQTQNMRGFNAASVATDPQTGDMVGTGNARLEYEGLLLTADEIRFNSNDQVATARGHVVLTVDSSLSFASASGREIAPKGAKRLLADEIVYRIKEKSFHGTRLRLGEYPLYISGGQIDGLSNDIVLNNATLFYHEPGPFSPTLTAEKIRIIASDKVVADKARLGIGSTSIIPFHSITQTVNDPIISHMTAKIGYKKSLGAFADLGLHLPISPGVKFGGDVGLYTARGLLFGPSGTYNMVENDHQVIGSLKTGYISDHGDKQTDILNRPIHSNRGFVQWQDEHTSLTHNTSMVTQLNYWSDSGITRDFRPNEFYPVQQPDSFVDINTTRDNDVSSLFFRVQPNTYYHVQQRLPELRSDHLPTVIGNNFYSRGSFSLAALREREFTMNGDGTYTTAPTVKSNRLDWVYSLSRPIVPRDWLVIDPVAAGRFTQYFDAVNGKSSYSRFLGELGVDASLRGSGVYNYKNEQWDIDGIRHLITPKLSYRYIPAADKGQRYIPQIDDRVFDTALPTLELADQRNIDDLSPTNVIRLGIDNTFQTRDKTYGSRDLLTLNIAGDYRFHRNPGEKDVSSIHTGFSLTPVRWMRFDVYNSFSPQDYTTRELNTGLTVLDGSIWSLSLSNHYLQHQIDEYITEGRYRLNEAFQAVARLHYDARKNRFNERSVALRQNLDNIWTIQYGVNYYEGRKRESNFGFSVEVRLVGL